MYDPGRKGAIAFSMRRMAGTKRHEFNLGIPAGLNDWLGASWSCLVERWEYDVYGPCEGYTYANQHCN